MVVPSNDISYTVRGKMGSGYKFSIKHCFYIDDVWYRPVKPDNTNGELEHRQPDENELGWDYIPFADDAIIESWEEEKE